MNREKRIRRLAAMSKAAKFSLAAESNLITEEDLDKIPVLQPTEDQWGHQEVISEDPTLEFPPDGLNEAIRRGMDRAWITIPNVARRKNIPTLYYLDPAKASDYEKYFGIKTEYGYLHTPATAALHQAMTEGTAMRSGGKDKVGYLVKYLITPSDYSGSAAKGKYLTLDPESERRVIAASVRLLEESHERPDLMRRLKVRQDGHVETTTSHSRGLREVPYGTEPDTVIQRRLELFERGMSKDLSDYRRLDSTVNAFVKTVQNRMEQLMKEQYNTNRTVRFEGSREEMSDVLKQVMLRKIVEALTSEDGPFADTELGLPRDYVFK